MQQKTRKQKHQSWGQLTAYLAQVFKSFCIVTLFHDFTLFLIVKLIFCLCLFCSAIDDHAYSKNMEKRKAWGNLHGPSSIVSWYDWFACLLFDCHAPVTATGLRRLKRFGRGRAGGMLQVNHLNATSLLLISVGLFSLRQAGQAASHGHVGLIVSANWLGFYQGFALYMKESRLGVVLQSVFDNRILAWVYR